MFCEVCGREIVGRPSRSLVEGVTMIVCKHCAGLGTELPGFQNRPTGRPIFASTRPRTPVERLPREYVESDLVEDYPRKIKEGREKVGLSQPELALKAKEKLSLMQKIEVGKMEPSIRLAKELEHILHVKLLVPREEVEVPMASVKMNAPGGRVGDVAIMKNDSDEEDEDGE